MWIDRRLLILVGGLSLLLNVFLVGLLVGRGIRPSPRAVASMAAGGGPVVHQNHVKLLSPEERHRFNTAMSRFRPAIRAAREVLRMRRQAVEAAMSAPAYDRTQVEAELAALRAAEADVAAKLHAGLLEAMAELPQPARAALVAHDGARGAGKDDRTKPGASQPAERAAPGPAETPPPAPPRSP